ncbi:MAG TPA: molybdate ABC transporter substrate-binding protein [Steroidobacteraceae bacterium]|nr:molybdate ABC transporter substrate-binding protein [Steroidobacteraceae bacterium]
MTHTRRALVSILLAALMGPALPARAADAPLLVFAASSLTDALNEIGATYKRETGNEVKLSFAASSALARQIEAGARADVFFSADTDWMDYLAARNLIDKASRTDLLSNRLVLIAPKDSTIKVEIAPNFPLAQVLGRGRLATGDPDSVPVGKYARGALTSLGVWNEVAERLIRAENVRSALAFVSRGEAPLGIVYETDALIDKGVKIVGVFPESSHLPIVYPVAATATAQPATAQFLKYLRSASARASFQKFGFTIRP